MSTLVNGLHHVTALAGDTQRNVDFYTHILGLRLVKKTVNFDAPDVYHLYYGDETGSPGSIMTFFPYGGIPRGRKGAGQLTYTAFSVPVAGMQFWLDRLQQFQVAHTMPLRRFEESYIRFDDFDGTGIELVFNDNDTRPGYSNGQIPAEFAVRGFHTVTLEQIRPERTIELLTNPMQHRLVAEEADLMRFEAGVGGSGNYIDIHVNPNALRALQGAGSVHHVAFSTDTDETQVQIQQLLAEGGYQVTPVQDRNYFHSIYFREPGGVLFEIATNPPGFAIDEPVESLGTSLKLPPQYEARRAKLEEVLPVIK
ncbi:Glyoxalase/bleomycin resistance protein/dioxygenase [Fibrella aestuarina BUZ 2]|uniref:Glyoxalase/bleomycin resistance protein/dioxygenase n=1 Tax=Fibrella aestuarina BUZ 2 TaxID=1166018 RepID=I0K2W5_9BACT|nr:ring-cleaving dioxygenase [Fibrella aestuarina]CCG98468.1 Glyoxalase/bleomycin resistance protein/dioxygenase [Fibrella aestuarina BUZ 2]